ncbi:guanine nucleotide exchange factor C9orf72-like [Haliotis rufescens]|uniref:guanine nucleotide exchange factor C9orf72-like n=1 Tax=Haliotis rufescens TaxID=6454 RepID=UPI001EB03302|nr:guanine nucleotide exchange factor C9orf72-like [Haliotis rufescens]XP_046338526.1 guanine nucleotide exchange factor C9orf72-like [Haliotis rufescens]XP_046338527.1 guanine nucleotide exchange factor C9orf72-like [Haliotis rufescens]
MATGKGPPKLKLTGSNMNSGVVQVPTSTDIGLSGDFEPPTTPLSPSSAFSTSKISDISQSYIDTVLLCHWDNILGPRLEHVWYVDGCSKPHNTTLRHICSQVLSGEICRDVSCSQIDYKFYDMPDKSIVVPAFIFSAQTDHGLGMHAIAFVVPNSELSIYLKHHGLILCWMTRLIGKFRIFLNRNQCDNGLNEFTLWLQNLLEMLSSLQEFGLPTTVQLTDTAFSPAHNLEPSFLRQAIASHLMTFGRSLVIGKLPERVNLVIHTLSMFNSECERAVSRRVIYPIRWPYHQDLALQGSLKSANGSFNLPMREMLCCQYPSSIIDVQNRDIKQSPHCQEHIIRHYETMKNELICLHYQHSNGQDLNASVLQTADFPESIVQNLLNEISKLPAVCGVREAHIAQFMRLLQRKALSLIRYVETETNRGAVHPRGLKKLKNDFNLTLEGDFRIVLATAEKLKPGIYHLLLGERKYDVEHLPNMTDIL